MANFDKLKEAIMSMIYSNDNQEITGDVLQQVLVSILSLQYADGRLFAGIAVPTTNPGTPDGNVFYLASKSGHYPNFGDPDGGIRKGEISILYNDNDNNWLKERLLYNFETNHENAYADDFLAVEDFSLDPTIKDLTGTNRQNAITDALNKWLDNVGFSNSSTESVKLGRCRLYCDGINLECYNYIINYTNKNGLQVISGPCDLTIDNKINYINFGYNQIYRAKHDGVWGKWQKVSDTVFITQNELDNLSDNNIKLILNGKISNAFVFSNNNSHYYGKANFITDGSHHIINIIYVTHNILKYDSGILKPVIQKAEGTLTESHDDKFVYVYQKTYNNNAAHPGGDVPLTTGTWSKWKLIGGTAYNSEILEFLKTTYSRLETLEEKTLHTNAYTDDFLAVDDFAKDDSIKDLTGTNRQNAIIDALNKWLDNVTFTNTEDEIKKLGRCRLFCDGINIECYNYIVGFDGPNGIQTVSGPCDLTAHNKINHINLGYNQIYRVKHDGVWGEWIKK